MGITPPKMILPPESQQWGNWVQNELARLGVKADLRAQGEDNTNQTQAATIAALQSAVGSLETTTGTLSSVLTLLTNPSVNTATATGFALTTGGVTVTSLTLAIPAGATRAFVTANAALTGVTGSTGGEAMFAQCVIAGIGGPQSSTAMGASNPFLSVPVNQAVQLTGLVGGPGKTISVSLAGRLYYGPGSGGIGGPLVSQATLSASALFMP